MRAACSTRWIALALVGMAPAIGAQAPRLPFFVGERLEYRVQVGRAGAIGRTTMLVDTAEVVNGTPAWVLRFDFSASVGPIKAVDRTESWFDPERVIALRFHKHEKHPLSRHDERVELPADRAALDELSFMYFLRTLPLDADTTFRFERHYDPARNPTLVRVVGRSVVTTGAGTFRTVRVEMRVQDPRRYKGEGVILLDLTDDHCRLPVRIESVMPLIGRTTMTLATQNHPPMHHLAMVAPPDR